MRILITGGAGTLGIVDRALAPSAMTFYHVFATGKRGNVPAVDRVELVEGSISDPSLVDQPLRSSNQIFVFMLLLPTKIPMIGMRMRRRMFLARSML